MLEPMTPYATAVSDNFHGLLMLVNMSEASPDHVGLPMSEHHPQHPSSYIHAQGIYVPIRDSVEPFIVTIPSLALHM